MLEVLQEGDQTVNMPAGLVQSSLMPFIKNHLLLGVRRTAAAATSGAMGRGEDHIQWWFTKYDLYTHRLLVLLLFLDLVFDPTVACLA
jgi:hypothetical protein